MLRKMKPLKKKEIKFEEVIEECEKLMGFLINNPSYFYESTGQILDKDYLNEVKKEFQKMKEKVN